MSIGNTEESVGLRALVKSSARPACVLKKWCRLIKINDMAQAFNVQKFCLHDLSAPARHPHYWVRDRF